VRHSGCGQRSPPGLKVYELLDWIYRARNEGRKISSLIPGLESALNLQGDAMFKRQKKLDEYYTGRARCQAESASGAGFGASSCKTPRTGPEKRPHFTPNKRLCEAGEELDAGAPRPALEQW
jgi:hypothetical protein